MGYYKKPTLKKFIRVCETCKGTVGQIAKAFNVTRKTVYDWCHADEQFQAAIDEYKGQLLDECIRSARAVAIGIPEVDPVTKKIVGWKEKPDGYMLRYLMSTLGRREGFGENIDVTTNGKDIKQEKVIIEVIDSRDKVITQTDEENEE